MTPAHVAIGAVSLDPTGTGGLNRYTAELLRALLPSLEDATVFSASPALRDQYEGCVELVRPTALRRSDFKGNLLRLIWNQTWLPVALRRDTPALFYSPVAEGMIAPPCPQIITIHDLVPLRFPEIHSRLRYYFEYLLPRIAQASAAIVVDSLATERDVRSYYRLPDKPIHVVYPGFSAAAFHRVDAARARRVAAEYGLGRFLLWVGEARPYKNLRRTIEAFAAADRVGVQLAVVGKGNKLDPNVTELPNVLGVADRVRFLGTVSDADLAALYSGAEGLVFTSRYEGFGLPPLEAMACGCPVVASRAASIPEVCGDAAVYVDPGDTGSIVRGVRRLLDDAALRESLAAAGMSRARTFTWSSTARQIGNLIDQHRAPMP